MEQKKRRTKVQSVALNEYLLDRSNALVKSGKFGSVSDVIVTALTEFLIKHDALKIGGSSSTEIDANVILNAILQTTEGKKALEKICKAPEDPKSVEIPPRKVIFD